MNKKKKKINIVEKIKKFYQKKIVSNKLKYNFKEILVVMTITFGLGIIIGGVIMYFTNRYRSLALNEFISVYDELTSSYYKEVDNDELLESGIKGMIGYLGDPYSTYLDTDVATSFSEDVEGTYQGIGAEIKYAENKVTIGRVFENSPAEKAGLKEGDILIKVEGNSIKDFSLNKISSIVKGEKGTNVTLTVIREKKELDLTIERGEVDSISVTSEVIEKIIKKLAIFTYLFLQPIRKNNLKKN